MGETSLLASLQRDGARDSVVEGLATSRGQEEER